MAEPVSVAGRIRSRRNEFIGPSLCREEQVVVVQPSCMKFRDWFCKETPLEHISPRIAQHSRKLKY
jgi:hypothetical protein